MSRYPQPGERRGPGKIKGTKNKATIQKELIAAQIAERTVMDARTSGKKLAKEVLEDFMILFGGMAAFYQPSAPGAPVQNHNANRAEFYENAKLAVDCARMLAPYQSPTFKAVDVALRPVIVEAPQAPGIVTRMDDPVMLAQIYRRMIGGKRG